MMILGLASTVMLAACGGDDDGGGGGGPLTEAEQEELCAQVCDHEAECTGDETTSCLDECLETAPNFAGGQIRDFAECVTESCDAREDDCLLELDTRDEDEEVAAACLDWVERCDGAELAPLCDLEEPEGGATFKLYRREFLEQVTACFEGACEDLTTCLNAL